MKKVYLVLLSILFALSCVSTNNTGDIEPLWFSDDYDYLSPNDYLIFKGKGLSIVDAETEITKQTAIYKDYINPKKVKEYTNNRGISYLLYAIEKDELESVLRISLDNVYIIYRKYELDGDTTTDVLEKISSYNNALSIFKETRYIVDIAHNSGINIDPAAELNIKNLMDKLKFTRDNIVFSINVIGDLNGSISSTLKRELNHLGYKTCVDGLVEIEAILTLTDADLVNKYINKYWDLQLNINNLYGDTTNSITFSGRESQITESSLNQTISRVVSKKIIESLKVLIP